jgi:uncharacterized protein YdaU (DUF1376 family)
MNRPSTLPFFQVDSGQVITASLGRSLEDMGMYLMLQALYWEAGCRLPSRETLHKKLYIGNSGKKKVALESVLEEFFPDGIHEGLDHCRDKALEVSRKNAANAKKGHERHRKPEESASFSQSAGGGPEDFPL